MHFRTVMLAGVGCAIATPAIAAASAGAAYSIDLPTQSLPATLLEISRTAGLQLLFTDRALTQLTAPRLHGRYTVEQMLHIALANTGYTYRFTDARSIRIERDPNTDRATPIAYQQPSAPVDQPATLAPSAAVTGQPGLPPSTGNEIVVVGSQIAGSKVTQALPVTILNSKDIGATGAVSGDELFRSIPQLGDVTFNSSYLPNSSNSARGDVGSVNLRNLGVGNTLVLQDGYRVVTHPTSQADDNLVPVLAYNTNAIPVAGIAQMEVLRDGAAAIYGSDAVAGVIDVVLRKDYKGLSTDVQYGYAQGTGMHELDASAIAGTDFAGGKGNITVFADYTHRSTLSAEDQDYTASSDKRPLFDGTRFAGAASLDGRSTVDPWGYFQVSGVSGSINQNGHAITSAGGYFHIQPQANPGCLANFANGTCIDDGSASTSGDDRNLRYDQLRSTNATVLPRVDRGNIYATAHYEIAPDVELFGEGGLYLAKTRAVQTATGTLSATPITVPASNYWNPFGATTLPDGSPNPNRLPGLTSVPASGLPVTIRSYAFVDAGPNIVDVTNSEYRLLGGVRFHWLGFKWETAGIYSEARVHDRSDGISATLLQQQLALSTPDAYDPFNGGNLADPSIGDPTKSSQAALDAIRIKTNRIDESTLALGSIKASNNNLLQLPGGGLGLALGAEVRRETQEDNRDPRVDGTTTFTDSVTGINYASDLVGSSASPDTHGSRTVESVYAELAVPVISRDMNVPLVRDLELQLAGRYEHYSDAGSVAKPKVAGSWDVFDGVRLRGSYSQGFKAPNLEQVNATVVTRSNSYTDWVRCEADLRAGRIDNFADCSENYSTTGARSGNPKLKPETSTDWTVGTVIEPHFIPSRFGHLTLTADYWDIRQKGIVGIFGEDNALTLDYLLRTQGSSNPDVVRDAPTADDIAQFAGTGLSPVGRILYVTDEYRNLLPQHVSGIDLGFSWQLRGTSIGDFSVSANAAYLLKFYQSPSPDVAALIAARAAGQINAGTYIFGGGNLLRQNGKPRWKVAGTFIWDYGRFELGAYTQYTSSVEDTDLIDSAGAPWMVDSLLTGNVYGQVTVGEKGGHQMQLRLGVRNVTNAKPPLDPSGYLGTLYNPYARYLYVNVRTTF